MSRERRHNLPAHRVRLIGRKEHLTAVRARLLGAERGLLTLTGAGGCGKTSLAVQVAHDLLDSFPDGVWLVSLAPLSDPDLVPQAVASVLGVHESADRRVQDALLDFLIPRAALLVLDNCEHVVAACASLAETLLEACPNLQVLATSREPLRIGGEVTWRVPSLAAPDLRQPTTSDELAAFDAVQLFVARAAAARSDFALRADNVEAVARICARLEGLPLALELAAARVSAMTVDRIAERLDGSFDLLSGARRTAASRQQTLRATLDWSHELLPEAEQMLLRRLAVFAGGWTLEPAEAVCRGDGIETFEIVDLLARLVDKSLVVAEMPERYRLLEPVRQYAVERLRESGEADALRQRHAAHFLALAEAAEPNLHGPMQVGWLRRLGQEHDNLRAALSCCLDSPAAPRPAAPAVGALVWFWYVRGHLSEGRRWLRRLLAADAAESSPEGPKLLKWVAFLARLQGDLEEAWGLAQRAVVLERERGDRAALAGALVTMGQIAAERGDVKQGRHAHEESLSLFQELGNRQGAALALGVLGESRRLGGDLDGAAAALEEGVALSRTVGNAWWGVATWTRDLAEVVREQGDVSRAAALLAESLALAREIGDQRRVAQCLDGFATLAAEAGRAGRAAQLLGAAQTLRDASGAVVEVADRSAREHTTATVRQALGDEAFAAAWDVGRVMLSEQAIEMALAADAPRAHETGTDCRHASPLTTREQEVAALVARGLTNRRIAETLVIAEGTADRHVSNILGKLGLGSRAALAVWTVERELRGSRSE